MQGAQVNQELRSCMLQRATNAETKTLHPLQNRLCLFHLAIPRSRREPQRVSRIQRNHLSQHVCVSNTGFCGLPDDVYSQSILLSIYQGPQKTVLCWTLESPAQPRVWSQLPKFWDFLSVSASEICALGCSLGTCPDWPDHNDPHVSWGSRQNQSLSPKVSETSLPKLHPIDKGGRGKCCPSITWNSLWEAGFILQLRGNFLTPFGSSKHAKAKFNKWVITGPIFRVNCE